MRQFLRPLTILAITLCPSAARAATIPIGFVSFDVLISEEGGNPGVNVFTIANLTGDPALGGYALPPDFPVITSVTFLGATLAVEYDGSTDVIPLGDLSGGFLLPLSGLEVSSAIGLRSATFEATLGGASLLLADASMFTASSPKVSVRLLPSTPPNLSAGVDFVLITVSDDVTVPEPATHLILGAGVALLLAARNRQRWRGKKGTPQAVEQMSPRQPSRHWQYRPRPLDCSMTPQGFALQSDSRVGDLVPSSASSHRCGPMPKHCDGLHR